MFSASTRELRLSRLVVCVSLATAAIPAVAQQKSEKEQPSASAGKESSARQAELEAKLSKMLSGATLEGSFTLSGATGDAAKLHREKYTLGEVKKISDDVWLFPARVEYGGKDVTLPIPLPVRWAGDTPMVVVDEVMLPGFGAVSARVLFFDNHYAGYWKHGEHSGNLFGEIHPAGDKAASSESKQESPTASSSDNQPAVKKP